MIMDCPRKACIPDSEEILNNHFVSCDSMLNSEIPMKKIQETLIKTIVSHNNDQQGAHF